VKLPRKGPSNARIDYRWPVDREEGFEKTSMIYGRDGRLVGIDYQSAARPPRELPPKPSGSMS
jgi:hypothetical protein